MVGSNGPRKQHELFIISRNLPIHSLFQGIDEVLTAIKVLVILPAFKLQSTSAKPTSSTWQGHMPNILQQHHVSGSLLPSNASPFPSSTIEFSGSSPRTAQSAAVHALREAWRSAHPTFLSSLDFKKLKVPHHLNGLRGLGGVSDTYIAQMNIFQLVEIREGAAAATAGYPAGNAGIGKEDISSAGGWWDDRMGDSHRGDAEQSQDGRAAFADASAADADAADAAPHHEAQVQASLRQANIRRLWRP